MRFDSDGDLGYQLDKILNEGILLSDNMDGGLIEFTSTGNIQIIEHNLGRVPIGFDVLLIDGDSNVWAVNLASWNNLTLSLNTNVANLTVRLFVM